MIKKYLNTFLIIFILILIIIEYVIFGYLYYYKDNETENVTLTNEKIEDDLSNLESDKKLDEKYFVEVKGAVNNPGVYEVTSENIINDVITLSGGFKNNAYSKNINLSKKVSNEMVIYVYTNYEYNSIKNSNESKIENVCKCPSIDISSCVDNGSSIIKKSENASNNETLENEKASDKININTCDKEKLTTLSGIGEAKAQKIIDYRNEHGPFSSIEEIKNVSGISEKLFEQIKEFITV